VYPFSGDKKTAPKICPILYRIGPNAGSRKCWFACKPAINNPAIEKISVPIRFIRIRCTTRACWLISNPGAIPKGCCTSGQEKMATNADRMAVTKKAIFAIWLNTRQAALRFSRVITSVSTGIMATASAPPEMRE